MSFVNLSGLFNAVTKVVTRCLKTTIFAVFQAVTLLAKIMKNMDDRINKKRRTKFF